jgi:hypothetical protein
MKGCFHGMAIKEQWKLCGSAPTRERLEKDINAVWFYGSTGFRIMDDGTLFNIIHNRTIEGYRIIQKKGRWRFERMIKKEAV